MMDDQILFINEVDTDSFLSTYAMVPVNIEGKTFPSVEHYYQSKRFIEEAMQKFVGESLTAREAVTLGNSKIFDKTCEMEYPEIQVSIMYKALYAKFSQHEDLRKELCSTDYALLINTSRNTFWGTGDMSNGRNVLGLVLMQVRDAIRKDEQEWMLTK